MIRNLFKNNIRSFASAIPKSVPNHQPPVIEETPEGRYCGILFNLASKNNKLDKVNDDFTALKQMLDQSQKLREFVENTSYKKSEQLSVVSGLNKQLDDLTVNFLETLIENKKLPNLENIILKFDSYIKLLDKEENIRIISHKELNAQEKDKIKNSLEKKFQSSKFNVKYEIDKNILGGLQIYFGNSFLDCSAASRIQKLKTEFFKLQA